jgi:hypothetical protein
VQQVGAVSTQDMECAGNTLLRAEYSCVYVTALARTSLQHSTGQDRTGRIGQDRTGRIGQGRTKQDRIG